MKYNMRHNMQNPKLVEYLTIKLQDRPLAAEFMALYGEYCNLLDDEIDEQKDSTRVRNIVLASTAFYNCMYWKRWGSVLVLLEKIIVNQYFDSVKWEKSEEEWKRQHAKVYSHAPILMYFAVILIEFGDDELANVSLLFREEAYNIHKEDKI
jgi:hypothetical protein